MYPATFQDGYKKHWKTGNKSEHAWHKINITSNIQDFIDGW